MHATLTWHNDTPVSIRYDDPYFSASDGAAEAAHVFLAGIGLPARLCPDFHIAELGFGTGLNLLVTRAASPLPLRYTSFEAALPTPADAARALSRWPRLDPQPLLDALAAGATSFPLGPIRVELILGDARDTLPRWQGRADAWYLDGFSPARNPELWEPALLAAVAAHTAPSGTFATYTAAGHVRRALAAAGFEVQRRPGFGTKRHMTAGRLPGAPTDSRLPSAPTDARLPGAVEEPRT